MSQNNKTNNKCEKYSRPEIDAKWENTFRKNIKHRNQLITIEIDENLRR